MTTTAADLGIASFPADNTHLIGGEWVPALGGEAIEVINPANQGLLRTVPRGTAADIDAAVQAAAGAFPAWRDTSPSRRAELLYQWADLCGAHEADLERLEAMEVGRPSWGPSPLGPVLRYIAGLADKVTGLTLPTTTPDVLGLTLREPYGVVGSIIPWNRPGPMFIHDVAPAIAAGNTIVVKPAEDAPLTALLLAALSVEAGIPPGVVNVVTGYGTEAGAALPAHRGIRRMSFTGSPVAGRLVMAACSENLTPLHLELGGKSPQVVLDDADLARAVPSIVGSITYNTGQTCAAGSRVVVDRRVHGDLVRALADAFRKVRVGPWHATVQMGPLVNAKQHERVLDYIAQGRSEGAQLVCGGGRPAGDEFDAGFFVEATLFDNVDPGMRIAQEEIFGPVLSVIPVDGEDQALEVANGTDYGLFAAVWTKDVSRAVRMARQLQAGRVAVNAAMSATVIGAPFGGYRTSGFGRTMGSDAVLDYTQIKSVAIHA
jgi:aldehyde dehydrogenase (NAD+)